MRTTMLTGAMLAVSLTLAACGDAEPAEGDAATADAPAEAPAPAAPAENAAAPAPAENAAADKPEGGAESSGEPVPTEAAAGGAAGGK